MTTIYAVRYSENSYSNTKDSRVAAQKGLGRDHEGVCSAQTKLVNTQRDACMIWLSSAVLSVVVLLAGYWGAPMGVSLGSTEPPGFLLLWTRYSAHLAFFYLIAAFSASTLTRFSSHRITKYLMRHRRQLGLGFATAHFAHLTALSLFLRQLEGFAMDASTAVAGFGYAMLIALTVTSNDWSTRRLGRTAWRRLHTAGINILMLYFFVAFTASLLTKGGAVYGLYIGAITAAVIAKVRAKGQLRALTPG